MYQMTNLVAYNNTYLLLNGCVGQKSRNSTTGSSAQCLTELKSRDSPGLRFSPGAEIVFQVYWLQVEFISLCM